MNAADIQKQILEAVKNVVRNLPTDNGPKNSVGIVVQDPDGFKCIVNINGTEKTCILPEHLHTWVSKDDIVIVEDIYGNESELIIKGSSGSTRSQTLVVNDENKQKLIGGVTKFEETDGALTDNDLIVE